jgi:hypothetical protein
MMKKTATERKREKARERVQLFFFFSCSATIPAVTPAASIDHHYSTDLDLIRIKTNET